MMPSELGELTDAERAHLDMFARDIGLVFQIRDDLLEMEQDTATLGKNAGSDADNDKSTYPSTLGLEGARRRAAETQQRAIDALQHARRRIAPAALAVGLHPDALVLSALNSGSG